MRLSAAIRKGSLNTAPAIGTFFTLNPARDRNNQPRYATCALGAAMSGASVGDNYHQLLKTFPSLMNQQVYREEAPKLPFTLATAIILLNDVHGWSREQIADWLESHGE